MFFKIIILSLSISLYAQLDTAALSDNTWVNLWNLSDPLSVNSSNWAYENDFHSHPYYGFFIMGPGHTSHPQDCYWYPFDPIKKKWTKIDSPRRPPRQCLSSFAVSSQDTVIMQMGGFEASHQQSQGKWDVNFTSIDLGGSRGAEMWVYSFNRNEWYPMKGPVTLPTQNATQLPQYDPVHDIVISTQGGSNWIYNFHTNTSMQISSPAGFTQYYYSVAVDTRRGLYYALYLRSLYCFNPETNSWSTIPGPHPACPPTTNGASGIGLNMMAYDEVNDVMLYIGDDNEYGAPSLKTWIFLCDSLKWIEMSPVQAPQDRGRLAYNRPLNAFMLLGGTASGDISRGGGTQGIWMYRYKRGSGVFTGLVQAPQVFITSTGAAPVISWNSLAGSGATGYNIYRGTANPYAKAFVKLNSSPVTDTSFTDASAALGTGYAYKVCAISNGVEGERSRILYTRPGRVLNVVASIEDTTVVRVSWDANPASQVTGYLVYRAKGAMIYQGPFPSGYARVNAAPITGTEIMDTVPGTLKDKVARGYVVLAINGLGDTSGVSPECTTYPESPEWAWVMSVNTTQMAFRWKPPRRTTIKGVNLYRVHASDEAADGVHLNIQCGGGNYFFPTYTIGTRQNGTITAPALITDSVTNWSMPPNITIPPGTDIVGYYLQGKTFIARAVNFMGQEGFGTDQISPNNIEYGYGIVPNSTRFKYNEWLPGVSIERPADEIVPIDTVLDVQPNPFNPACRITVSVPAGAVKPVLSVYSLDGRMVRSWALENHPGRQSVLWNSTDIHGQRVASGVYIARFSAGSKAVARRMLLAR